MKNSSNQEIVLNYLFWGTFASIEGGAREIWNIKSVPPLDLDNLETFPCFSVFIITVHYSIQWYRLDVIPKIK